MKKFYLVTAFIFVSGYILAQPTVTLLTFAGHTFSDRFSTQSGSGNIGDGLQLGGGLEIGVDDNVAFELIYQNLKTDAFYQRSLQVQRIEGNLGINYIMAGGTRYLIANEVISGFGTLNLGAAWSNPDESLNSLSVTKFAIGGRLGARFIATEKISLRFHVQLFSPVQWASGGFFFGTGGSGAGVSTGSTIFQFNLGGSVNFRIK